MKNKILFVFLIVLSLFLITACKNDRNDDTQTTTEETTTEEITTEEKSIEEYYGIYGGGHETQAMGSTIVYRYTIELREDKSYEIQSYLVMGDVIMDFVETGTYEIDLENNKITITPEGQEAIEGDLNNDGTIKVSIKPSMMASERTEAILAPTTTSSYAGIYINEMEEVTVTLFLTHGGEYYYLAVPTDSELDYVYENGTYSVEGTEITFDGDEIESQTGVIEEGKVTAQFILSEETGVRVSVTLELDVEDPCEEYYGIYGGGHETQAMGSTIVYRYTIELKEDKSYEIQSYLVMGDVIMDFVETGTYEIDLENNKITITPEGQEAIEGELNNDGTIKVSIKPSMMASERTEAILAPTTTSSYAGIYINEMEEVTVTLFLTHGGEYYYLAVPTDSELDYVYENGTYSVEGTEITFDGDEIESQTGVIEEGKVTAQFILSQEMGVRVSVTLEIDINLEE